MVDRTSAALQEAAETSIKFKNIIHELKVEFKATNIRKTSAGFNQYQPKRRQDLLVGIQNIMLEIIQSIAMDQVPKIKIRNQRCWSNSVYKDNSNIAMVDRTSAALQEAAETSIKFKNIIHELKVEFKATNIRKTSAGFNQYQPKRRQDLLVGIQNIMLEIIQSIAMDQVPKIKIRNQRCWSNSVYKDNRLKMLEDGDNVDLKFCTQKSQEEFSLIVHLLGKIYVMLSTNKTCTKRELYYQDVEFVGNQKRIDNAIDKISCLLNVPPWELGVLATSKGLVAGPLRIITSSGSITECNIQGGALIPQDVEYSMKLETKAEFVILIEKDTIFQKLLDENFLELHGPCILITGKGVPDMNTRVLVKCIHEQLSLPVFMLADADPYGIEIMSVYRFGSLNLSHLADVLAVPSILWLGIHPSDLEELKPITEQLSQMDIRKARSLLRRPYMATNRQLYDQINLLLKMNSKSKIENIGNISNTYLTDVYIPMKILTEQFI